MNAPVIKSMALKEIYRLPVVSEKESTMYIRCLRNASLMSTTWQMHCYIWQAAAGSGHPTGAVVAQLSLSPSWSYTQAQRRFNSRALNDPD